MPPAAEVHVLQAKIGCKQKLEARGKTKNGGIIPNATHHNPGFCVAAELPDFPDQLSFAAHRIVFKYMQIKDL
jgi:hypothetical protein